MRLGMSLPMAVAKIEQRILRAEELGFDSVWSAETCGADAMSPLAYIAAFTTRPRGRSRSRSRCRRVASLYPSGALHFMMAMARLARQSAMSARHWANIFYPLRTSEDTNARAPEF